MVPPWIVIKHGIAPGMTDFKMLENLLIFAKSALYIEVLNSALNLSLCRGLKIRWPW